MNSKLFNIPIPLPLNLLRNLSGVNPLIVNYHIVSDEILPHIKHIYKFRTRKKFEEDLEFLRKHYEPIDLYTFLESRQNGRKLPKNSLLLTIDDGLKEIYSNMAPILQEKKFPATIFLTKEYIDNISLGYDHKKSLLIEKLATLKTNEVEEVLKQTGLLTNEKNTVEKLIIDIRYKNRTLVDKIAELISLDFNQYLTEKSPYVTSNQVKQLIDQGFTIGGHSIDHAPFKELSIDEQIHQVIESVDFVCNSFGLNYRVFAFPYWDAGISTEFFNKLTGNIDATFGTQGLLRDSSALNNQRIGFERFQQSVKRILKVHYVRKLVYQALNQDIIRRPSVS